MDKIFVIGVIWIMISIYNYMRYITPERKQKTNLLAFVAFALVSPIISIVVWSVHLIQKSVTRH